MDMVEKLLPENKLFPENTGNSWEGHALQP
jgi:hypothetical protein